MTITNFLTKGTGLAGIFLVGRDSHLRGIAGKNRNPQTQIAKDYPDMFVNSQRLNSTTVATATSDLKKWYFNYCLEDTVMPAINGITGYIKGFNGALVDNIVPLSLSLGAICLGARKIPARLSAAKSNLFKTKNTLLKAGGIACTVGLLLMAAKGFIFDICGVGQYKKL